MLNTRSTLALSLKYQWVIIAFAIACMSGTVCASSYFGAPKDEFLKLDDAFKSTAMLGKNSVEVHWKIAPKYYLYEKKFRFKVQDVHGAEIPITARPAFSPVGLERHDEFMGQVVTYGDVLTISIPIQSTAQLSPAIIRVDFQGCAEDGLCYPPSTRELNVKP